MTAAEAQMPAEAYIYVIGDPDGPQKIGVAADPKRRLALFQTGNHLSLRVNHCFPVSRGMAEQVERYAHHLLADAAIRGEWFAVTADEAARAIAKALEAVRPGEVDLPAAQCRTARALLEWSRKQLADAAGVAERTAVDFERGARSPTRATLAALRRALEDAGVEFLEDDGVKRRLGPACG